MSSLFHSLIAGKSVRECQRIYLRFKDRIFEGWSRPYSTASLEAFIKKEIGAEKRMADIAWPRLVGFLVLPQSEIKYGTFYSPLQVDGYGGEG